MNLQLELQLFYTTLMDRNSQIVSQLYVDEGITDNSKVQYYSTLVHNVCFVIRGDGEYKKGDKSENFKF